MTYQTLHSSLSSALLETSSMLTDQTLGGQGRRLMDTRASVAAERGAIKKRWALVQRVEACREGDAAAIRCQDPMGVQPMTRPHARQVAISDVC